MFIGYCRVGNENKFHKKLEKVVKWRRLFEYVNKCSHSQPEDKRSEGSNEERKQAKHIRLCTHTNTHSHIRRHIHTLSHWQTNVYSTNFICWTNKSNNGDSNRAATISAAGQRQINVPSEKKRQESEGERVWSVREADANMAGHKTHTTCATRRRRQIPANAWKRGTSFTPRLRPSSVPTI